MKRPIESDYTSHVAYTCALEAYCDMLEKSREWLGLDWTDLDERLVSSKYFRSGATWAESKLKERNA